MQKLNKNLSYINLESNGLNHEINNFNVHQLISLHYLLLKNMGKFKDNPTIEELSIAIFSKLGINFEKLNKITASQ